MVTSNIQEPPKTIGRTLMSLGPGMIIAGSIVGSGELIAATKVGAESGFWLLWLIIIGCVIKVFTQVEFGRHTVTHGETPLYALNSIPGPRFKVNWLMWYWVVMSLLVIAQQGGIVGGVGQALSIAAPVTDAGQAYNESLNALMAAKVDLAVATMVNSPATPQTVAELSAQVDQLSAHELKEPYDAQIWATAIALLTSVLLFVGKYRFIQLLSTVMVIGFTLVTLVTLGLLQTTEWAVTASEVGNGLSFKLPPSGMSQSAQPLTTALAAFGIIGIGAAELIMYPYWCLEKGYAKSTGPRQETQAWAIRARGWMRVMVTDAWVSMVIYTFATIAFFLLGAAVLGRTGLNPEKGEMVRTLSEIYRPVFGDWAQGVFLLGAFAVLYSTFFVAAAGYARMVADAFGIFGFHNNQEETRLRWTRVIAAIWPLVALVVYLYINAPAAMVLASGLAQAIMLPMLGVAALFFRFKRSDQRLRPGKLWDSMLWLSFFGFVIAGGWAAYSQLAG